MNVIFFRQIAQKEEKNVDLDIMGKYLFFTKIGKA